MSQPDLSSPSAPRGVLVQRPRATIYTVLLAIALVAILLGCLFLWMEIRAYGGFGAVPGRVASAAPWQPAVGQPVLETGPLAA